jgi:hypothetical protein
LGDIDLITDRTFAGFWKKSRDQEIKFMVNDMCTHYFTYRLVPVVYRNLGIKLIQNAGFSVVMKDSASRFWAIEHITGMLIAIILITIARGKAKVLNYSAAAWLYLIALILILATVPWPFREGIGRHWLPGM